MVEIMKIESAFQKIEEILNKEGRWTPKAFERFQVSAHESILFVPLWGEKGGVKYDFGILDPKTRKSIAHKQRPKGCSAELYGNLEFLNSEVWIVEGEWDLFAAFEAGLVSVVTSTNGAGSFSEKMANRLAGKEVRIVFDNDSAGRGGAEKAAALLKNQGCKIKILDLSAYVEEAGDLRDFFNNGNTLEDLLLLCNSTEYFMSSDEADAQKNSRKLRRLSDIPLGEVSWFWHNMIPRGAVTLLTGDPGSGKSTLVSFLAATASKGGFVSDSQPTSLLAEQRVVVFSVEDPPEQVLKPRLSKFHANEKNIYVYHEILNLDEVGKLTIREVVAEVRPSFVVIDPIVAYLGEKIDTSKANAVRDKMNFFAKLAEEFDLAILVVRHMAKASQGMGKLIYAGHGSIDFTASVRSELMLLRHPTKDDLRLFGQVKSNFSALEPHYQIDLTEGYPELTQDTSGETLEKALSRIELEIRVSNFPHIVPPNFLNTVPLDFHDCVPVDFLDVVPRYLES